MKIAIRILIISILATTSSLPQTEQPATAAGTNVKLEKMPEGLETRYALSALPPKIREAATVYLLDPAKGYVLSRKGTNGFNCIVVRTDWQFPDQAFRDDIFWPVCYDAEGSKTLMQDFILAAEMRARGMDSKQVNKEITKKFGTKSYPNPARVGVAYMIEPVMRTFGSGPDPMTMNMPHYMFYAPNVKNSDIGGNPLGTYPFILSMSPGRDDYIIMLVGDAEKDKIIEEHGELLKELCSYRDFLCTTEHTRMQKPG